MEEEGQTSSPAERQIRPPPLSQHLREFAANPHAWAVLGRNLIPVVGIYGFGWSAALSVFSYWFDGLTALAAIVAAVVLRLLREMPTKYPEALQATVQFAHDLDRTHSELLKRIQAERHR